ncbi:hypothetical protein [Ancrocorticia populi]|nr:hypothetical protein [Ancrocorticia populi]
MKRHPQLEFPNGKNVATVSQLKEFGVKPARLYAEDMLHPIHGVVARRYDNLPPLELQIDALRRRGILSHQIKPKVLKKIPQAPDWLPAPEDVWSLLGATASVPELVQAGDFLVSGPSRQDPPLCSIADLQEAINRFTRCRGTSKLRDALPLVRTGVESPAESKARLTILDGGFEEPITCCPVDVFGITLHSDLGYPELKIAIEYDGNYHFSSGPDQIRSDEQRRAAMRAAGWEVLTMTVEDLRDPTLFYAKLRITIHSALSPTTDPHPRTNVT